jgi:hypothetical protein
MQWVIPKWWTVANNLISGVEKMVNDGKWAHELLKPHNKTELIELFLAKATWHQTNAKLIPHAWRHGERMIMTVCLAWSFMGMNNHDT